MKAPTIFLALLLCGCASTDGVKITEADRATCKASQDCTVWSREELRALILKAIEVGKGRGI